MTWLYAIGVGPVAGVVVGALAEQVPLPPLLRSVGSAVLADILGEVAIAVIGLVLTRYWTASGCPPLSWSIAQSFSGALAACSGRSPRPGHSPPLRA